MALFNGLRTLNTIRQSDVEFARSQAIWPPRKTSWH